MRSDRQRTGWQGRLLLASLAVCGAAASVTLRKLLGAMPKDDPWAPHILQSGTGEVDIYVHPLGVARGLRTAAVDKWLGLPYALPPVNERRWRKPQPVTTWQAPANTVNATTSERSARADYSEQGGEPLLATTFAPSCMAVVTGGSWIRAEVEDEDCLYLNVYTPAGHVERLESSHAPLLPVVVYIHGGGFIMGSGSNPSTTPPPDRFVAQGEVVFVSMNYRLGPFSFLVNSDMEENGGMLGIQDQAAALRWVHEHIHAFGGDSTHVTLMGESAGAISICLHLVMPESRGLFQKAILESALCAFPFEGVQSAYGATTRLADSLGCLPTDEEVDAALAAMPPGAAASVMTPLPRPAINYVVPEEFDWDAQEHQAELVEQVSEGTAGRSRFGKLMSWLTSSTARVNDTADEPQIVEPSMQPLRPDMTGVATADIEGAWLKVHAGQPFNVVATAAQQGWKWVRDTTRVVAATAASATLPGDAANGDVREWMTPLSEDTATTAPGATHPSPIPFHETVHGQGRFVRHLQTAVSEYEPPSFSRAHRMADRLMLACMRNKTAAEVRAALPVRRGFMFYRGESWFPVINGVDVMQHPLRLIERGLWAREVEILYGHNRDEASVFLLFAYPFLLTEGLVKEFIVSTVGEDHAAKLWDFYITNATVARELWPVAADEPSLRRKVLTLLNDLWTCSSHYFASRVAEAGGRLRVFTFDHSPSYLSSFLSWLGAFHGAELDFVFGVHQSGAQAPTDAEHHLSAETMRLWTEFITGRDKVLVLDSRRSGGGGGEARTTTSPWLIGEPGAMWLGPETAAFSTLHVSQWPLFDNRTHTCVALQTHPITVQAGCRPARCDLWDATLKRGLMRVPPQTPEPAISVFANVWGPSAVAWLSENLVLLGLLVTVGAAAALAATINQVLRWRRRAARRAARTPRARPASHRGTHQVGGDFAKPGTPAAASSGIHMTLRAQHGANDALAGEAWGAPSPAPAAEASPPRRRTRSSSRTRRRHGLKE